MPQQPESRTRSTDHKDPQIVIEGMENILEMDLKKHKGLLERTKEELSAWRAARVHEKLKRKNWAALVGGGKFNDEALKKADVQIQINIRHFSDKIKLSNEKIAHHQKIVGLLEEELKAQYAGLKLVEEDRRGARN